MMSFVEQIRIRKYPNRRYYDASRSRHVTLDQIHQLIRDGHDIQVTDSSSGQDITAKVLAQIIVELDPPKLGVFPIPMLHRLLRSNEQFVRELASDWSRLLWGPFHAAGWMQSPSDTSSAAAAPRGAVEGRAADQQADLRRAVEELRRELADLRRSKPPRGGRGRRAHAAKRRRE